MLSPLRQPDAIEIERQQKAIKALEQFFNTAAPIITYYSCTTPKEVFEIKGFDYHPMMYVDTTGGLADTGNRVFSGNNSEFYNHEIVHLFVQKLFPGCDMFFNEGIAMYLAGSGNHDFSWHKNNVRLASKAVAEINFQDHLGIFARQYVGDTSLPYLTAALVCQRALRLNGTAALPGLMDAKADVWTAMESIGLNRENFNTELHKELQL
ncbi:MAG: hypothetical protein EOP49_18370 [Sphingobacteriales bacterium]|nr:MAG: hypothetical protein EOP49_18370 [Sphingobacteriales bacterium]